MKYETLQKRVFYPSSYHGDWTCDYRSNYNINLCRAGIRALLGHRLDRTRECIIRIYAKRPRTLVREILIVISLSGYSMQWKVKNQGRFKDIPFSCRYFLTKKFPSILRSKHQDREGRTHTFFIRATEGKKIK